MLEQRQSPVLPGWYTKHQWAERLGQCLRTIGYHMERGLKHSKVGATVYIHEQDF